MDGDVEGHALREEEHDFSTSSEDGEHLHHQLLSGEGERDSGLRLAIGGDEEGGGGGGRGRGRGRRGREREREKGKG